MIQLHPVDNIDKNINFWQEYPSFKFHKIFGELYSLNKMNKKNLKNSSLFMWLLSVCYDRKSSIFNQPALDKWEVASEDLFVDHLFMKNLSEDLSSGLIEFNKSWKLYELIDEFEQAIDTPLGITLRKLEAKLVERAAFIVETSYSLDYYKDVNGRSILKKGTADQLDRMFANTEKINTIIQKAMDNLRLSEAAGTTKGGQKESLGDGDNTF